MDTDTEDSDSQGMTVTTTEPKSCAPEKPVETRSSQPGTSSRVTWVLESSASATGDHQTAAKSDVDPSRLHRDSGYHTESQTSTPHFYLGDQTTTQFSFEADPPAVHWEDIVDESEDSSDEGADAVFVPSATTEPIHIPAGHQWKGQPSISYTHCTPPRGYIMQPHLSLSSISYLGSSYTHHSHQDNCEIRRRDSSTQIPFSSVPGCVFSNVLRDQNRSLGGTSAPQRQTVGPRTRHMSEAVMDDSSRDGIEELPPQRDRSYSAPTILTPAQRYCAKELRRISDEFDRTYQGLDEVSLRRHSVSESGRPSSYPSRQHNPTWWQNVVRLFSPQRLRQNRPPPSPIRETEPHLEDASIATNSVTDLQPPSEEVAMEIQQDQSDNEETDMDIRQPSL